MSASCFDFVIFYSKYMSMIADERRLFLLLILVELLTITV